MSPAPVSQTALDAHLSSHSAWSLVDGKLHRAWIEEQSERDYESMAVSDDAPIVQLILRAAKATGWAVNTASIGGGCDANIFNRRGIQSDERITISKTIRAKRLSR